MRASLRMSVIAEQIEKTLLPGMQIPGPLAALFDWIEQHEYYVDVNEGRIGSLFPDKELDAGWTDTERPGGTIIEFFAEGNVNLKY